MSIIDRKRNIKNNKTNSDLTLDRIKAQSFSDIAIDPGELVELPLDKIISDPNQPRKKIKNIENLAQTIRENQLIQPIVVREFNNQYMILVGERRYHAFLHLNRKTIPCIIKNTYNSSNILVLQLLENDQREKMHPLEISSAINTLAKNNNLSVTSISKKLGVSKDWVSVRKQLIHIEDKIKQLAVDDEVHDVRTLIDLNRLNNIDSKSCNALLAKIKLGQLNGSYREYVQKAIKKANVSSVKTTQKNILQQVEYLEDKADRLIIKIYGKKQPCIFIKTKSYHAL
jgi:ParB/RepB/Spo0J family partition protein